MATRTLITQFSFMHILMTHPARILLNPLPVLKHRQRRGIEVMTFPAVDLLVFTLEQK